MESKRGGVATSSTPTGLACLRWSAAFRRALTLSPSPSRRPPSPPPFIARDASAILKEASRSTVSLPQLLLSVGCGFHPSPVDDLERQPPIELLRLLVTQSNTSPLHPPKSAPPSGISQPQTQPRHQNDFQA